MHGAPTEEMEGEVKALLKTFDEEWVPTPAVGEDKEGKEDEDAVTGLSKGVEIMGKGLLASMAGGGGGSGEGGSGGEGGGDDGDGGGGGGGLLASMAAGNSAVEEDARASFVSAAAAELDDAALGLKPTRGGDAGGGATSAPSPFQTQTSSTVSVYGSDQAGAAGGAAAGGNALGADGDELYDLD